MRIGASILSRATLLALSGFIAACGTQPLAPGHARAASEERAARLKALRIGIADYNLTCPEKGGGGECWVPVVIKTKPDTSGKGCEVGWLFLHVAAQKNTRVVWYLNEYEHDGGTFEFGEISGTGNKRGIDVKDPSGNPTNDFDTPGHLNSKKHLYSWKAKGNASTQEQNYDINVFYVKGTQVFECTPVDPYIINKG